jgi:hypothetical protein
MHQRRAQPRNDKRGDTEWRERTFQVNRQAQVIEWRVADITDSGEILIDDIRIR